MAVEELMMTRADPRGLAGLALEAAWFPQGSRSALPALGTEASLTSLTADDLREFHRTHVTPQGAVLVVAGDLSALDLEAALESTLGTWRGAGDTSPAAEEPYRPEATGFHLVNQPGSVQSQVIVAWPSVNRDSDHWGGLQVAAHALAGDGLNSWLSARVREELAYTYGIGGFVDASRLNGRFVVSTAVESSVTAAAVGEILQVLGRARREGLDAASHRSSVDELTAGAPLRAETSSSLARLGSLTAQLDLPLDHADRALHAALASTPESVTGDWRAGVDLDHPVVVVVGDAATLAGPLGELGLGTPESLDL